MTKVAAIMQARMGSTRLPGKMLMDIEGKSLLAHSLERAKQIPKVDVVVLATTTSTENLDLLALAEQMGVTCYAGSESDVLDRYYQAARFVEADVIMRLTGDCPLLDPSVCYEVLERFLEGGADYVSNVRPPMYPDGLDTEVFSMDALESIWHETSRDSDREHVTQSIWTRPQRFRIANVVGEVDHSYMRWTVDEPEDAEFVRSVCQGLQRRGWNGYSFLEVLQVIKEDGLHDASVNFDRNEGQIKSMSQDSLDYASSMRRFRG